MGTKQTSNDDADPRGMKRPASASNNQDDANPRGMPRPASKGGNGPATRKVINTTPAQDREKARPTRVHGQTLGPIGEDGKRTTRPSRNPVEDRKLSQMKKKTAQGRPSGSKEPLSHIGPLKKEKTPPQEAKKRPYDWAKDGV